MFYTLTRDIPTLYPTTDVIDTYVFRALRKTGDTGMAAAAGLYQSIVGFVLIVITNYIVRKKSPENSLF
jgi:putative aldouronate transport system permease protein